MIETATGEGTGTLRGVIQKIIETDEVPQEHGAIVLANASNVTRLLSHSSWSGGFAQRCAVDGGIPVSC